MLKTPISYTCSQCAASKDQSIAVGVHPYSAEALPPKWAHVPAATGRANDKLFCGKKACEEAAAEERVKYEADQQAIDAGAASRFEEYVARKTAHGGVDPRWSLKGEERMIAEKLLTFAVKTGVLSAGSVTEERRQLHDLWTGLTEEERTDAAAALRTKTGKEEGEAFSRILAAWDARP